MGRKPSFVGEDTFLGRGVSYCATCDGAFYRDQEVAVVGMNMEAIEEATFLTKFASTVHWITPSDPKPDDPHALRASVRGTSNARPSGTSNRDR